MPDELERLLVERVAHATEAWPNVTVEQDQFACAIAERLDPHGPARSLDAMQTDDLYLACGCASGAPGAVAGFEQRCARAIAIAIALVGVPDSDRADVGQVARQRLLVASVPGAAPRIATYSARGSLKAWVRVVATREALRMLRRARREVAAEDIEIDRLIAPDDDPEVGYLKRVCREEFKRAFHAAVVALDAHVRLLLRQHTLDGISIDRLAVLHGVHRATVARWVIAARDAVVAGTQRELVRRLQLSRTELATLICSVRSQLDVIMLDALRG